MSNTFFAITNETTHESTKMKDWVWVCKDSDELIYDILVVPVATKRKPLAKMFIRTSVFAVNAYYYLKGMGFV